MGTIEIYKGKIYENNTSHIITRKSRIRVNDPYSVPLNLLLFLQDKYIDITETKISEDNHLTIKYKTVSGYNGKVVFKVYPDRGTALFIEKDREVIDKIRIPLSDLESIRFLLKDKLDKLALINITHDSNVVLCSTNMDNGTIIRVKTKTNLSSKKIIIPNKLISYMILNKLDTIFIYDDDTISVYDEDNKDYSIWVPKLKPYKYTEYPDIIRIYDSIVSEYIGDITITSEIQNFFEAITEEKTKDIIAKITIKDNMLYFTNTEEGLTASHIIDSSLDKEIILGNYFLKELPIGTYMVFEDTLNDRVITLEKDNVSYITTKLR